MNFISAMDITRCCRISKFFAKLDLILLVCQLGLLSRNANSEGCIPRKYNFDSVVCVCNATYCDTIPKVRAPLKGNYVLYTSSKDGQRFERVVGSFKADQAVKGVRLVLDRKTKYQKIFGFGAAFTDSAGINILSLEESTQDSLLKSYFSPDGLEYNLGRVPIGGTDFSTRGYTYSDDDENATLTGFNLTAEDFEYKIPIIKRAQSVAAHQLKLTASCWSPPKWMKTNHELTGYGSLKNEYYRAYSDYHIRFLDAYKKEGINFWCITTGNEPMNGYVWFNRLNAVGWTPINQRKWIGENLGPDMRSSHPDTCILTGDDQRYTLPRWLKTVMQDRTAAQYINGTAVHWYWDFIIPPVALKNTHNMFPNLFIINTESSYGDKPWDLYKVALGSWKRASDYAFDIISSINNWVAGWIDWNLALNEHGGPNWVDNFVDAAIIVNKTSNEFYKEPMFYALGHFSKFISPESYRIRSIVTPARTLDVLTVMRPDNGLAIIVLNRNNYNVKLTIVEGDRGTAVIDLAKQSINSILFK